VLWNAPQVSGNVPEYHDSPGLSLIFPAFSDRACEALSDMLLNGGELLPLATSKGSYFLFHVTRFIDAVDRQQSVCSFLRSDPARVVDIQEYSVDENKVGDAHIFRAYDLPINVLVTEQFVERVMKSGLVGFQFTKIWPLPKGTKWRMTDAIRT
jgi:hypothetical protein